MKKTAPKALTPAAIPETTVTKVGYRVGPPEIEFAGRAWRRMVAQPVNDAAALAAMKLRPEWALFEFFEE